jgi:hypothetical protein
MLYVLHDTTIRHRESFAEIDFRKAFKAWLSHYRAENECALWYGSDEKGWTKVYSTSLYPSTLSQPWR